MRFMAILTVACILVGCSSHPKEAPGAGALLPGSPEMAGLEDRLATPPPPKEGDLNDNESDMQKLPADMNDKVTKWIEYFQGRGREHMTKYLARSSRYIPEMKEIFRSHGLPEDLVYIALIESGFNPKAYSRARAVGYWQFIGGTGRRYGLQQNYYIDDRRDFIKSTEAAARYLKALYNLFGSWYLAIASYNVGENRIKNLVMTHYTRDFWELARLKVLPAETDNYVPKFLAARMIAKHPQKYGFNDVPYEAPLDFKEVKLADQGVDLKVMAGQLGVDDEELRNLNPSYKLGIVPKRQGQFTIRVPSHITDERVTAALGKSQTKVTMNTPSGTDSEYRIRRGDNLYSLAQRHNTSVQAIQEANNLSSRAILYPGKKIIIPGSKSVSQRQTAKVEPPADLKPGEKAYTVRQGDNLYTIAQKFGVSLAKIKERNGLGRRSLLQIGAVLIIPGT